jgi:hypothetical protein
VSWAVGCPAEALSFYADDDEISDPLFSSASCKVEIAWESLKRRQVLAFGERDCSGRVNMNQTNEIQETASQKGKNNCEYLSCWT